MTRTRAIGAWLLVPCLGARLVMAQPDAPLQPPAPECGAACAPVAAKPDIPAQGAARTTRNSARVTWFAEPVKFTYPIDDSLRQRIQSAYTACFAALLEASCQGETSQPEECFVDSSLSSARAELARESSSCLRGNDIDMDHHLQLESIDPERRQLTLSDRAATLYRLSATEHGTDEWIAADWKIGMREVDGVWRISSLVRSGASLPVPAPPAPAPGPFVRVRDAGFATPSGAPLRLRGFNYYPRQAPWEKFWPSYPPRQVEADFEAIGRAGANAIRVFIHANACSEHGELTTCHDKFQHLLETARRNRLYVIATLFDFQSSYGLDQWHTADRYLEAWLTPFRDEPALLAWDLKNEPDLDRRWHGAEHVDRFLTFFSRRIRLYDANHLVTIGWQNSNVACDLAEQVDFVSYHDYRNPNSLGERAMQVRRRCGTLPVVLQEFGAPSGSDMEPSQYDYFDSAASSLAGVELAGRLIWTWNDFESTPASVSGGDSWSASREARFGMRDIDGLPKPALSLVVNYFLRSTQALTR